MVVFNRGIELDLDPDLQMNELIFIMNSNAVKNEAGAGSERSSRTKSWVRVSGAPTADIQNGSSHGCRRCRRQSLWKSMKMHTYSYLQYHEHRSSFEPSRDANKK